MGVDERDTGRILVLVGGLSPGLPSLAKGTKESLILTVCRTDGALDGERTVLEGEAALVLVEPLPSRGEFTPLLDNYAARRTHPSTLPSLRLQLPKRQLTRTADRTVLGIASIVASVHETGVARA